MDIPAKYDPADTEDKWYKYWMEKGFFKSVPDSREPFTIVIPPPNVTGVLHMGHMLNNTIQDILIRRAKMLGYNTCWVPGTDHASIATEAKVVEKLKEQGIDKASLSREEFLGHVWEWREKHGGIILEQLKKLGASCDWERTKFTMDDDLSESVISVFIDLFNKGLIYRGVRMINWDPRAKTAVSDEEVIHKEVNSKLYYVRYKIQGTDEWVIVATTRPETILGDTAVCVNPGDKRFTGLAGKTALIPLIDRPVPVIRDEYVDMEFGTGCLKITPAHDANDYEIGLKHNLEVIDTLNEDGTLNEKAQLFIGKDRFEARELIVEQLEKEGYIVKVEDYVNKIGYSERTDVIIEPRLSAQWFLKMQELARPALENVMHDNIRFFPARFKNIYKHWMENVRDWCLSRQLWWGHRIPAYYLPDGDFVIAKDLDEAYLLAKEKSKDTDIKKEDLKQDEDVLDTWFSSWLWPISVFDGIRHPDNPDIKYYYPTNDLVTAPEIIFFWVARMIMSGYEYRKDKPFKNVYFTGVVRDKAGRKMSKQLGNSPDPIKLMEKYGADGVRVGMLLCSPAGNDLLFDESLTEQGRNFGNKIWNAFRLMKNWEVDTSLEQPEYAAKAIEWFDNILNRCIKIIDDDYLKYRLSDALMCVYRLFREEFCSWYLEIIKPEYRKPIDKKTYEITLITFDILLKLLHPFMPFITEEIWHLLEQRKDGDSIMNTEMPGEGNYDQDIIDRFELIRMVITAVRTIRKENKIHAKEPLELNINSNESEYDNTFKSVLIKSGNLSSVKFISDKAEDAASFIIKTTEYYVPVGHVIDVEQEIKKLESELEHQKDFLANVMKKLNNKNFINNAPEKVVSNENKKKDDAEARVKALQERINYLKG